MIIARILHVFQCLLCDLSGRIGEKRRRITSDPPFRWWFEI